MAYAVVTLIDGRKAQPVRSDTKNGIIKHIKTMTKYWILKDDYDEDYESEGYEEENFDEVRNDVYEQYESIKKLIHNEDWTNTELETSKHIYTMYVEEVEDKSAVLIKTEEYTVQ